MAIDDFGTAYPLGPTDRTELGQCLIELTWTRTSRQKEIELFAA